MATKKISAPSPSSDGDGEGSSGPDEKAPSIRLGRGGIKNQQLRYKGFRQIMKVVRDGRTAKARKASPARAAGSGLKAPRVARMSVQRVAVRLTYAKNRGDGNWRAHGRYLERESATGLGGDGRGFGHDGDDMAIAETLDSWQKEKDPNVFKLIISPEHGSAMNLREYTQAYMAELGKQLGTELQWVGADHYNTDNPHVHVALRGRNDQGIPLVIPREFIKGPLREIAQDLATQRLGHRTQVDIADARKTQIHQHRWTDLDRTLKRMEQGGVVDFSKPLRATVSLERKQLRLQLIQRLTTLETLGLARRGEGGRWAIDPAAETILRERQKANDRLKVLHSHRAMASDARLPLAPAPEGDARIAGRLIGTGMDDASQKNYMLLETLRGSVVYLYQSPSFEIARNEGMRPGDFVVVTQKVGKDGQGRDRVSQFVRGFGDADKALDDSKIIRSEIRHHIDRVGAMPEPTAWGGWLGKFHGKLAVEARSLERQGVIRQEGTRHVMDAPVQRPKRGPGRTR